MPAVNFVPAIPGTQIHINNTYHVPRPHVEPVPTDLNPVEDWKTVAILGLFILVGCVVWCFGPSNRSERMIRCMFNQDMGNEKKWRKQSVFVSRKKWHNIFVNLAFVFAWPLVAFLWFLAIIQQKIDDKQARDYEEACARARRVPMAGAEWGKCRMPLM